MRGEPLDTRLAHQAICNCGWAGELWADIAAAEAEADRHEAQHEAGKWQR